MLFAKLDVEVVIYVILIFAAMMTGFLDDASKAPWGEYKKYDEIILMKRLESE